MIAATEPSVLIVEDEQSIRDILVELFDVPRTRVYSAATLETLAELADRAGVSSRMTPAARVISG